MSAVYLDHAATSPIHPDVLKTMHDVEERYYGNPSSIHRFGREARQCIDEARHFIAESIGAKESEIIFTSGGTEADNLAIVGTALQRKEAGRHILTTALEHHAVLHSCEFLQTLGFDVTYVQPNQNGTVLVEQIEEALRDDTILVSVMLANNEIGTVQPISQIGRLLKEKQIPFHTDAVQAYGVIPIDVEALGVDLLAVSAHKMNGPKGIGFLYAREGVKLSPLMYGGQQEQGRRAGTENAAGITGFHTAVELSLDTMQERKARHISYKQKMLDLFTKHELDYVVNGEENESLPHILNVSFPGASAEALLVSLDLAGVAASSGSACTAGTLEPSHVLQAMHTDEDRVRSAIRYSFGLGNTMEQVEKAAFKTIRAVKRIIGR